MRKIIRSAVGGVSEGLSMSPQVSHFLWVKNKFFRPHLTGECYQ